MLIKETLVTVRYKKIEGIKKAYYKNEEILRKFFNEATVLPIPEDAPLEIPRIIVNTLNEHGKLNIAPIATTFEVCYDNGFEQNWDECAKYLAQRMEKVFEFLSVFANNSYEYVGVVANVLYDEIKENGTDTIVNSLLNANKINNIYDINIKYTFVEKKDIFVNIMLQNARIFNEKLDSSVAGFLSEEKQIAESIGAVIDINDRYGFNKYANHSSGSDTLKNILQHMGIVINNKLSALIEKGEY
ncbi:MAG: hypothetical protein ACTTH0_00420 [Eubacteriales bacterium]